MPRSAQPRRESAQEAVEARPRVPVGSRERAVLRDSRAEPARRCGAAPRRLRMPRIQEGVRGAPAPLPPGSRGARRAPAGGGSSPCSTRLALRRGAGSAPARCGQSALPGVSAGLPRPRGSEVPGGVCPGSSLLPVIPLPIGLSELSQNRWRRITVDFVSPKSCLEV